MVVQFFRTSTQLDQNDLKLPKKVCQTGHHLHLNIILQAIYVETAVCVPILFQRKNFDEDFFLHQPTKLSAAGKITKVYHCSTKKLKSSQKFHWHWPGFNSYTFQQLLCFSLLMSQLLMVILFVPEPFNNLLQLLNPEEDPGDTGFQRQEPLTFWPTTHSVPHQRTFSLDLQTQQLITITCFSFLYTHSVYTRCKLWHVFKLFFRALHPKSLSVFGYSDSYLC